MSEYGQPVFGTVTDPYPIAQTVHGKVLGENRDQVAVFHGIPYGGRCDRERRFLPPVPADDWDGVMDCTKNGPISVQIGESIAASRNFNFYYSGGHPEKFGVKYETQDENCLVLNVLTPGIDTKKRPVLVYIHGGGFATNSGSEGLGSDVLVREQDVVVVSINHRLHIWGYLYLGHLDEKYASSGNNGQLDLILALQWVKDNIANFGGDPENVTLFGESGGGGKINTLLHMPAAAGLYHKAIVVSGSMQVGTLSKEKAAAAADAYLAHIGITKDNLEMLEILPARMMSDAVFTMPKADMMGFSPVGDDINLPYCSGSGYEPADFASDIPLILGASEDEMACFTAESSFDITPENYREKLLEKLPHAGIKVNESNVDELISVFEAKNTKMDTPDQTYLKMISVAGVLGGGPYRQAAETVKKNTAPVYQYLNKIDVPHNYLINRSYAWHTFDPPLQMRIVPYAQLEGLSKMYAQMWCNFMRTADPSIPGYTWKPFTAEKAETFIFDNVCYLGLDPLKEEREIIDKINSES